MNLLSVIPLCIILIWLCYIRLDDGRGRVISIGQGLVKDLLMGELKCMGGIGYFEILDLSWDLCYTWGE